MTTEFLQSPQKGGMSRVFGKPLMKAFKKDATSQPSKAIKKIDCSREGDQIFQSPCDTPHHQMQLKFFNHPRRQGGG
jgi:hypothetical protein